MDDDDAAAHFDGKVNQALDALQIYGSHIMHLRIRPGARLDRVLRRIEKAANARFHDACTSVWVEEGDGRSPVTFGLLRRVALQAGPLRVCARCSRLRVGGG